MKNTLNYLAALPKKAMNDDLSLTEVLLLALIIACITFGTIAIIDPSILSK